MKDLLYPDSRVVKTGTGCISLKREIIVLPKILGKYMSYNFWVAPLEFISHKVMKLKIVSMLSSTN
jgi:hypothetical protein